MPHGEKMRVSDWDKIKDVDQQEIMHPSSHEHQNNFQHDPVTDRAFAALNVDSSDDSCANDPPFSTMEIQDNVLQNSSDEISRGCSNARMPTEPVASSNASIRIKEDQQMETQSEKQNPQSTPEEVVDLTFSSDEENEPAAPVSVEAKKSNESSQNNSADIKATDTPTSPTLPSHEQKRGTGMRMIYDETQVTKPVPAAERLPFLSGKLTISSRQLVLRGVWGYLKTPDYTLQRFELISDLPAGEPEVLPTSCKFYGWFVLQTSEDEHSNITVVEEKDVHLYFYASNNVSAPFTVKGSGMNKFGRFDLTGTATKTNESTYSIVVTKTYVETFPSDLHEFQNVAGMSNSRKRKSETSSAASTNTAKRRKSSCDTDSNSSSPVEGCPAPKSADSPPSLTDEQPTYITLSRPITQGGHLSNGHVNPTRKKRDTVFDEVHIVQKDNPRSKLTTWQKTSQATLPSNTRSGAATKTSSQQSNSKPKVTWTIRDIRPCFPKTTIDFCEAEGIHFVNDLLKADIAQLHLKLMSFPGFRLACAMAAWKTRRRFHDIYQLSLAKQSIKKWNNVASAWWKKTLHSDWSCEDGRLSNFLSTQESSFLERNFGIISANQLLLSNQQDILDRLRAVNDFGFNNSLWEGMFYSWIMRAQEKSNNIIASRQNSTVDMLKECLLKHPSQSIDNTHSDVEATHEENKEEIEISHEHQKPSSQHPSEPSVSMQQPSSQSSCKPKGSEISLKHQESSQSNSLFRPATAPNSLARIASSPTIEPTVTNQHLAAGLSNLLLTPMSCLDFLFMKSQRFTSDAQLAKIDLRDLTPKYCTFLESNNHKISLTEASRIVSRWKNNALRRLGKEPGCFDLGSYSTRIDKSPQNLQVMYSITNLGNFTMRDGLPEKTIYTFDDSNNALYKFKVTAAKSQVPNSGNGAFLSYEGCRVLKETSYWKRKLSKDFPPLPQTRRPLTAVFAGGRAATVTLKGKSIHGDEYFYGPDNGIGMFNEYTLDDFVEVDNICFSSKHVGCAMIEIERYAPLLPEDRKTDLVFGMKDFIFSHEPMSWRFDVKEQLDGHNQVVDFTDDTTGFPHDVAQRHLAMYVNEVGHDETLVENVCPLSTPRSVSYYAFIDKPMKKGESVELLVNYGEAYEEMRVRRGYGKSNGCLTESDADNFSRVRRNLKDRMLIEDSILSCSEEEIHSAIEFFATRVWNGLVSPKREEELDTIRRQNIARRRLHWLARKFHVRLMQLCLESGITEEMLKSRLGSTYYLGMFVYINGWMPKDDPRPIYSGIATIDSILEDQDRPGRLLFDVTIPGSQKTITFVPEEVVTLPVEEDFTGQSKTVIRTWKKNKLQHYRLQLREQMLVKLESSFQWDSLHLKQSCPNIRQQIIDDYRWEVSEELLFLLLKHNRLSSPFDKTKWCPLSQTLLQNVLHAVADNILADEDTQVLCNKILSMASESAKSLSKMSTSNEANTIFNLSIVDYTTTCNDGRSILIVKSIENNHVCVKDFLSKPQSLDVEWYLCHQIVMVIHSLASLIDWTKGSLGCFYSLQHLCDQVGLDHDSPYLTFLHTNESWIPLVSLV